MLPTASGVASGRSGGRGFGQEEASPTSSTGWGSDPRRCCAWAAEASVNTQLGPAVRRLTGVTSAGLATSLPRIGIGGWCQDPSKVQGCNPITTVIHVSVDPSS